MTKNNLENLQIISQNNGPSYIWDSNGNMQIIQTPNPIVQPDGNPHYVPAWIEEE